MDKVNLHSIYNKKNVIDSARRKGENTRREYVKNNI